MQVFSIWLRVNRKAFGWVGSLQFGCYKFVESGNLWNSRRFFILICLYLLLDVDMAARHRARASSIQILKVEVVPSSKCRRPHIKQMHVSQKCFSRKIFLFRFLSKFLCWFQAEKRSSQQTNTCAKLTIEGFKKSF